MSIPIDSLDSFRLAYALRHSDDWPRAIQALGHRQDRPARDGLIELLIRPPSAKAAVAAIESLATTEHPNVIDALELAADSPHVSVRLAAVRSLADRNAWSAAALVSRRLERDPAWLVRRAAVEFLAALPTDEKWDILKASNDPHWRVRHALIQVLLDWGNTPEHRAEINQRLSQGGTDLRTQGLLRYLDFRHSGQPPELVGSEDTNQATACEFWDWDPAVLAWRLEQMSARERREFLAVMPGLIGHEDDRVRRWSAMPLLRDGDLPELLETLRWLDDPRHPAFETVMKLMEQLDWDHREQLARRVFDLAHPSPGQWVWALNEIDVSLPAEEIADLPALCQRAIGEPYRVRAALARLLCRVAFPSRTELLAGCLHDGEADVVLATLTGLSEEPEANGLAQEFSAEVWPALLTSSDSDIRAAAAKVCLPLAAGSSFVPQLAKDGSAKVRQVVGDWLAAQAEHEHLESLAHLQRDENSLVRAAALTVSHANILMDNPAEETSWLVLEQAARLSKTPLWNIAPEPLPPEPVAEPAAPVWLAVQSHTEIPKRRLAGLEVSLLGISGHYGLPVEGFVKVMETGINLMFWEPNYLTLTSFLGQLRPADRRKIHMVAGTFEASPKRIRQDVERALAKLQIEQLAVFLLFWTRSWNRITDEVRIVLDALKRAGQIGTYGLSTHNRPLAVEAIQSSWNPVMVRHSAAHRGAETAIFPHAQAAGTGILTFNNTCYGRLLEAIPKDSELTPADCYRYTLSFEAVTACWSAPSTVEELQTNLAAYHHPELPNHLREQLQSIGEKVYREDTVFRQLVRGV